MKFVCLYRGVLSPSNDTEIDDKLCLLKLNGDFVMSPWKVFAGINPMIKKLGTCPVQIEFVEAERLPLATRQVLTSKNERG